MADIFNAFKRAFSDWKKVLVGTILGAIPLISLIVGGFGVECAKKRKEGDSSLPSFGNFFDLLVKGIQSAIIGVFYILPPFILTVMVFALSSFGFIWIDGYVKLFVFAILVVWMVIATFASMMGVVRFARGKFRDAFDVSKTRKIVVSWDFFTAWIVLFIAMLAFNGVIVLLQYGLSSLIVGFSVLSAFVVEFLFDGFMGFISVVVTMTYYADVYDDITMKLKKG